MPIHRSIRLLGRVAKNLVIDRSVSLPGERYEVGCEQFALSLTSTKQKNFIDDIHLHSSAEFDFRVTAMLRKLKHRAALKRTNDLNSVQSSLQLQLGFDLYAIKKTLELNGRVKLKGSQKWFDSKESSLAHSRSKGLCLEGVDLSFSLITRNGLNIYADCDSLQFMSLKKCVHVDSWFVTRMAYLLGDRIRFIDLSGCPRVDSTCIAPMCNFRNLTRLKLFDLPRLAGHELMLLELNEALPNCLIEGLDYFVPDEELSRRRDETVKFIKGVQEDIRKNDAEFLERYVTVHPETLRLPVSETLQIEN